jgi:predicted glutamine amidotransferase
MLNLFLIALLLQIIFQTKEQVLSCGLFGYVGAKSNVNPTIIRILGMQNDARGGDSCGVLVGGTVYRSLGKFKDWIQTNQDKLEQPTKKIIGHTRNSSYGKVSLENAHPFLLKEDGKSMIGAHNGTIYNTKELAEKYQVKDEAVDSKTLMNILFEGNLDVLEEYEGSAALVWSFAGDDKLYMFRGESPSYKNGTYKKDERPLFYWNIGERWNEEQKQLVSIKRQGIYFSSLHDSLVMAGAHEKEVKTLPTNKVFAIHANGTIEVIQEIDRSKAFHTKAYTSSAYNNSNYSSRNYYSGGSNKSNKSGGSSTTFRTPSTSGSVFVGDHFVDIIADMPTLIAKDGINIQPVDYINKVYMAHGLYFTGRTVMHSAIPAHWADSAVSGTVDVGWHIDEEGNFLVPNVAEKKGIKPVYFFRGYLCKDKESYDILKRHPKNTITKDVYASCVVPSQIPFYSDSKLTGNLSFLRGSISAETVPKNCFNENSGYSVHSEVQKHLQLAHGTYYPPFVKKAYTFKSGSLVSIEDLKDFVAKDFVGKWPNVASDTPEEMEIKKVSKEKIKEMFDYAKDTFEGIQDYIAEFMEKYPVDVIDPLSIEDQEIKVTYIRLAAIESIVETQQNLVESDE